WRQLRHLRLSAHRPTHDARASSRPPSNKQSGSEQASSKMAQTQIEEPSRKTAVFGEYEVVVLGGGPAGVAAALAAGRCGRSPRLTERSGFLGGAGTAAGLSTFCGLHAVVHGRHERVIHGIATDILERLASMDGLNQPHLTVQNKIQAQAYDISAFKIAA